MRASSIQNRLRAAASELLQIAELLDEREGVGAAAGGASDKMASEVEAKIARRECLGCGRAVPDEEPMAMGLGKRCCYFTLSRAVREGKVTREELVRAGRIAPEAKPGGRPAKHSVARRIVEELSGATATEPEPKQKPAGRRARKGGR